MSESEKNGNLKKSLLGYIITTVILTAGVIGYFEGRMSTKATASEIIKIEDAIKNKANVSDYQRILQRQDEVIKELQICNIRLAKIETILEQIK